MAEEKLTVLCLNDWPVGIYTSEAKADEAALKDWKKREPRWQEQGLQFKEALGAAGGLSYTYTKYFYHQHEFVVDAEAKF
jgi:hypothetical protein